jgi:NarL family two-component system response regulator LiaR
VKVIAELVRDNPAVRIVLFTAYAADDDMVAAFQAGAIGYLSKTQPPPDLLRAIEHAAHGQTVIPPAVAENMRRQLNPAKEQTAKPLLSKVEWRVLVLLAQGYSNKDIARHLTLSCLTVSAHVSNILSKLKLANRTQVALYALKQGWVKLDELPPHPKHDAKGLQIAPYMTMPVNATGLQRPPR